MAAMVTVKCKNCGRPFEARVADRKRGWGSFCNKSCKAIHQEKRTGQHARSRARRERKGYAAEFGGIPQFADDGEYIGFTLGSGDEE